MRATSHRDYDRIRSLTGPSPILIRRALPSDLGPLASVLSRAFADDPVMRWLLPHESSRTRRLRQLFEGELKRFHLPFGQVWTTWDIAGAAMWSPPGHWRERPRQAWMALPQAAVMLGTKLGAALKSIEVVERAHPTQLHWYLATVGTQPARQGVGIGSALLAPTLQHCDAEGVPAYLESSNEANLDFYAKRGFEVTGFIDLPCGGPRLWPMWREPQVSHR